MSDVSTWDEVHEQSSEYVRNYHKFTEPGKIDPHKYCEFNHPRHDYPVIKVGARNPNYKTFYEVTATTGPDGRPELQNLIEWGKRINAHVIDTEAWNGSHVKEKISMRIGVVIDTYMIMPDREYEVAAIYAIPDMPCVEPGLDDDSTLIFDKQRFLIMQKSIKKLLSSIMFSMRSLSTVNVEEFASPPNIRRFGYNENIENGFSPQEVEELKTQASASYFFYEYYDIDRDCNLPEHESPGHAYAAELTSADRHEIPELSNDMIIMYVNALHGKSSR